MATKVSSSPGGETPTKDSLEWFQKRRDRWKAAPRRKLQALSPKGKVFDTSRTKGIVASATIPSKLPSNKADSIETPSLGMNSASTASTSIFGSSTTSTGPTSSTPLFGGTVSSEVSKPLFSTSSVPVAKPLFGASATTTAAGAFGATRSASKPSIVFASAPTKSSGDFTKAKALPSDTKATTLSTSTSIFSKINLVSPPPATTSASETKSTAGSIFGNIQLTPSKPVASTKDSIAPSQTAKGDTKTSIFGNIKLTPSSAAVDAKTTSAASTTATTSSSSAFGFKNSSSVSKPSEEPSKPSSIFGNVKLTPSTTTTSATAGIKPPTNSNPFASVQLTPSKLVSAPATKSEDAPKSIFGNISLVPSKPHTTAEEDTPTSAKLLTKPQGKVRNPTKASSSKPVVPITSTPLGAPSTNSITQETKPSDKEEETKPTGGIFANISLTASKSATQTPSFGSTTATPAFGSGSTTFGSAKGNPFGMSSFSIKSSATTESETKDSSKPSESFTKAKEPTATTQSLFGSTTGTSTKSPFTFGAPASKKEGTSAQPSSLFGSSSQSSASPFSFGAPGTSKPLNADNPVPVLGKMSLTDKETEGSAKRDSERSEQGVDHKARLLEFYKKHNPEKLDSVDSTLEKYKGKETELFQKLEAKYAPEPVSKFPPPQGEGPICYLEFSIDGEVQEKVHVQLFADQAPLAAENFQTLCNGSKGKGRRGKHLCYKNSKVHRVVPLFCVQLGDFTTGDGTGGESIFEPSTAGVSDSMGRFKDEKFMQHSRKGLVSMANNGANRNSSQFFFTLRPCPSLDGKHVVFGEVVKGMDVIEAIGKLDTTPKQNPRKSVVVSDCGEIKDGKEVPCKEMETQTASSPFGFGAPSGSTGSVFGASTTKGDSKSPFGFGATTSTGGNASPFSFGSNANKSSPFTFGAVQAPSATDGGAFGKKDSADAGSSSFGASSSASTTDTAKPFGFGSATAGSSLSFGTLASNSESSPSKPFGGATDASPAKPFGSGKGGSSLSFGSLASNSGSSGSKPFGGATGASPFSFGSAASNAATGTSPFPFGTANSGEASSPFSPGSNANIAPSGSFRSAPREVSDGEDSDEDSDED